MKINITASSLESGSYRFVEQRRARTSAGSSEPSLLAYTKLNVDEDSDQNLDL